MKELINHAKKLHRAVFCVTVLVFICLVAVSVALGLAIAKGEVASIGAYASAGGPLLAALSVALIADRQIHNEGMQQRYEHDLAVVQSMHQVIFLAEDLKDLVGYIKHCYEREDERPSIAVLGIHQSIRQRFDGIAGDHIHKWMTGACMKKLHALRPSIFGMCLRLSEMERDARAAMVRELPLLRDEGRRFDGAIADLEAFIQEVISARKKLTN